MAIVRGWCPNAWRPMMAGDGLLLRVKPPLGRLTRDQLISLATAARTHGNGQIDLTRRANLQLRGLDERSWPRLRDHLVDMRLVDAEAETEAARNLIITPDWHAGDDSDRLGRALLARGHEWPRLPGKVGVVIDAGAAPMLHGESGDFRIERGMDGRLILRADGRHAGMPLTQDHEIDALLGLAHWFVESGGLAAGRMARHAVPLPAWAAGTVMPATPSPPPMPGQWAGGLACAVTFGRITATTLERLGDQPGWTALRLTPWRMILVEGDVEGILPLGLSCDPTDPLRHVDACPGRPECLQASVETRMLARRLAPHVAGRLHVSGCAKGCAGTAPAEVLLTGHDGRYALSFPTANAAAPARTALSTADILTHFGAH